MTETHTHSYENEHPHTENEAAPSAAKRTLGKRTASASSTANAAAT